MYLLNSKSIIDCNAQEVQEHNQEIKDISEKLQNYQDYDCAAIIKYFDEANKDKEPIIKSCNLHNCDEMIEYVDSKNGVDIAIVEDFLTYIVYGQGYSVNDKYYLIQTGIQIRPYDKKRNFIKFNELALMKVNND
ncbi:hypothetical protein [Holdemanella porci]|uniref:hypothetical protein n=1 Tax=Holdemanella porci TaxID=2652276 RepID=UPI003AB3832A